MNQGLIVNIQAYLANSLGVKNVFSSQAMMELVTPSNLNNSYTTVPSGGSVTLTPANPVSNLLMAIDYSLNGNPILNNPTPGEASYSPLSLQIILSNGNTIDIEVSSLLVWDTPSQIQGILVTNNNPVPVGVTVIYG